MRVFIQQIPRQFAVMTLAYEDRLLFTYAANLARRIRYPSDRAGKLMKEVVLGKSFAELREVVKPSQPLFKIISRLSELPCLDEARYGDDRWQKFCRTLNELESAIGSIPPNLPARRVRILGELLKLTPEDIRVLGAYLFEVQLSEPHDVQIRNIRINRDQLRLSMQP